MSRTASKQRRIKIRTIKCFLIENDAEVVDDEGNLVDSDLFLEAFPGLFLMSNNGLTICLSDAASLNVWFHELIHAVDFIMGNRLNQRIHPILGVMRINHSSEELTENVAVIGADLLEGVSANLDTHLLYAPLEAIDRARKCVLFILNEQETL